MTTDHDSAGPYTAPNRRAVVISTEMHASRRLGRLLELTGLAAHIERHSAASMVVTGGPTEMVVIDASPTVDGVAQVEELRRGGVTTIIAILPVTYAAMVSARSSGMTEETTTASLEVLAVEPVSGKGRLLALATVALVLDGVEIVLQGVKVTEQPGGGMKCDAPTFRHPDGAWYPAVVLPPELGKAIADEVFSRLGNN